MAGLNPVGTKTVGSKVVGTKIVGTEVVRTETVRSRVAVCELGCSVGPVFSMDVGSEMADSRRIGAEVGEDISSRSIGARELGTRVGGTLRRSVGSRTGATVGSEVIGSVIDSELVGFPGVGSEVGS